MKTAPVVVAALVLALAFSGCGGKKDTPTTGPTTPTTPTRPTNQTGGGMNNTTQAKPPVNTTNVLKYVVTGNDANQTFKVEKGAVRLKINATLQVTADGAYLIAQTPPEANAFFLYKVPDGAVTKKTWTNTQGTDGTAGEKIQGPLEDTISGPKEGDWIVGVSGTGTNMQVRWYASVEFV